MRWNLCPSLSRQFGHSTEAAKGHYRLCSAQCHYFLTLGPGQFSAQQKFLQGQDPKGIQGSPERRAGSSGRGVKANTSFSTVYIPPASPFPRKADWLFDSLSHVKPKHPTKVTRLILLESSHLISAMTTGGRKQVVVFPEISSLPNFPGLRWLAISSTVTNWLILCCVDFTSFSKCHWALECTAFPCRWKEQPPPCSRYVCQVQC